MSDNFEKYKGTLNDLYRQTKENLWTTEFATLVLLLGAVLFLTFVVNSVFYSFGNWFITFIVYFVEIAVALFVLYRHQQKIYQAVREKALEMEATHPGIFEAFQEWRS